MGEECCRVLGTPTAPWTAAPHLVQLGLVGLEVIGDTGPDLLGLPPKCFPEVGGLLALCEQRDLRLALPLVLVDLLSKEPVGGTGEMGNGGLLHPQPHNQPYLALVVLLSVAWAPRHTKRLRPWSRRKTNLEDAEMRITGRERGPSASPPRPGVPVEQDLNPHPCRKVLEWPISTPELQL